MSELHLVTGGAGFFGQQLVTRLAKRGVQVRSLDLHRSANLAATIEQIQGDICNRDQVRAAMDGVTCVHSNAAYVPVTRDTKGFARVNTVGSTIVAQEAQRAKVARYFHISTSAIFDLNQSPPYDSNTPLRPFEPYGKAKLAGEQQARDICATANIPFIAIRPRTIIGRGRLGVLDTYFSWMAEDLPIPLIGDGSNLFQFIHADDLLDCYMLVLDQQLTGNFNVGCAQFNTLGADLQATAQAVGSKSRILNLPVKPAIALLRLLDWCNLSPFTPWHYATMHKPFHFNIDPLLKLGWQPQYSNVDMLTEAYHTRKDVLVDNNSSVHLRPLKEKALNLVKLFLRLAR